jgi:hypothetical protein
MRDLLYDVVRVVVGGCVLVWCLWGLVRVGLSLWG